MPLRLNLLTSTGRKPDALALGGAGVVVSGVTLFAGVPHGRTRLARGRCITRCLDSGSRFRLAALTRHWGYLGAM